MAHGGDGAVETDRGIVLVPGVLPGERVGIAVAGRRRGAQRGRLLRLLEVSPARVPPACPSQPRCGGCPWMIWADAGQQAQKRRWVEEAVTVAVEGQTRTPVGVHGSRTPFGYRRRARLSFYRSGQGVSLGYRVAGSRRVLDVSACLVLAEPLQRALEVVRARLRDLLVGAGELELALGRDRIPVMRLACNDPQPPTVYSALRALVTDGTFAGACLALAGGLSEENIGDPRECFGAQTSGEPPLWGGPGGFSQANEGVNRALVAWVCDAAQATDARVLELYAGHGNFSVALAQRARTLVAIEQHPGSAAACRDNLAARGITTARVVTADVAPLPRVGPIDAVVLDPPRTGARAAVDEMLALKPKRIVYVSCDMPTLTRDLRALHAGGYCAVAAHAFDMFPQTAHVEAAVLLSPRSALPV